MELTQHTGSSRAKAAAESPAVDQAHEFCVVMNHEQQYALWLAQKPLPSGWQTAGVAGDKETCLSYIEDVWTDMCPLSLRKSL